MSPAILIRGGSPNRMSDFPAPDINSARLTIRTITPPVRRVNYLPSLVTALRLLSDGFIYLGMRLHLMRMHLVQLLSDRPPRRPLNPFLSRPPVIPRPLAITQQPVTLNPLSISRLALSG